MNENYNQINIGQPMGQPMNQPMGQPMMGQVPQYGQPMNQPMGQPMMGQVPQYSQQMNQPMGQTMMGQVPQYSQQMNQPMGQTMMGQVPQYGQPMNQPMGQPMMGQVPQYGQPMNQPMGQPMMGQVPQYGQPMGQPMMGQVPQYSQPMNQPMGQPMMGQAPQPFVPAPVVPFQGLEPNRQHIKTQDEVKNNEIVEKHIKGVLASRYMLAFAILVSVQIACIIASIVLGVGYAGIPFLPAYIFLSVIAWVIWGTSKKGKFNNAGPIMIKVQSIINIVQMGIFCCNFLLLSLLWAFVADDVAQLVDTLLYAFIGLHSNLHAFGAASGIVMFLVVAVPAALFIILQVRMIILSRSLADVVKQKIQQRPKTLFTIILLGIFAVLSGILAGIYIYMISRSLVMAGFIMVLIVLVLNVGLFGLLAFMLILIARKTEEEWDD